MQKATITENIKNLPLKQFEGPVTVVEDPLKISDIVDRLQGEKTIGFDTETKPAFKKGVSHNIALLQLSTEDEAFLFRLNQTGLNNDLIDLLANSDVEKVGVAIRDDIKGLQKLKNFKPGGFIELQNMAPKYNIDVLSLKNLAGTLLGFRISKRQRLSNWEANQLTEGQILYAATDAWVSLKIYNTLKNLNPVNPNADNDSQSKKDPKE